MLWMERSKEEEEEQGVGAWGVRVAKGRRV